MAITAPLDVAAHGPGWARWRRALWYHGAFYLQTWRASVVSVLAFPIFYLLSMGLGVGKLVNEHTGTVAGHTYIDFVAPALVAVAAMQMGENESLWPVLASVKWVNTYHAAVNTPLEPEDVAMGKLGWVGVRLFLTGMVYTVIIAAFGAISSWWAVMLPFVALLTGLAFAAPFTAYALTRDSDSSFVMIYRFLIVPMFLFSATFYPLSVYPGPLRVIVQIMPLYHGVALARASAFGAGSWASLLGHICYLGAFLVVGLALCRRFIRRRLAS
jgi:lipooligosaccharide transport system permease protein